MIELLRIFTSGASDKLDLHVELNGEVFGDIPEDKVKQILKLAGAAMLSMTDDVEIQRDEEFVK